jgi:septal ring factor EnvC (AmiA/AmiB activator)
MNHVLDKHEPWMQQVAGGLAAIAAATVLVVLILQLLRNERVEAEIRAVERQVAATQQENEAVESRLARAESQARQVSSEVSMELEQRERLFVAMADVLARAKMLQDHREQFEIHRYEVEQQISRLDQHYLRARGGPVMAE